ncbi:MAG: alpha/beta fold hydrolase [Candidatus Muirbacterium halophilum]|nr:alpha/beta fold hydrolase [Candidatus Muirbacterium halophilum]MCK9476690.1 alpha/beta fold hydrolase [Candidatus Muirbacterium halophilum]
MIIKSETFNYKKDFFTINGEKIENLKLSYQTYGKLNENKDNTILICHFFSGDKHIAGKYSPKDEIAGWWDNIVGPNKPFDTNKYFIISSDSLCCVVNSTFVESSSPRDYFSKTKKPYSMDFPVITIQDMVNAQKLLLDYLGIEELFAVSGPSMGGLQALSWAFLYPQKVKKCIPISAADKVDCFSCFFPLRMGIQAIKTDSYFNNGDYYNEIISKTPIQGLKNAINGLALIARGRNWGETILGGKNWDSQDPILKIDNMYDFEKNIIEGVGSRADMYDANSYIYLSKANIIFNVFSNFKSEKQALQNLKSDFLILSDKNDIFILAEQSKKFYLKIAQYRKNSEYYEFESPLGHLGSVSNAELFGDKIQKFLNK